jgi:hypothetical protein
MNSETPAMLSETALAYLSALTYRPAAERQTCFLPLGGIYWDDEIPDIQQLMRLPEDGLLQILQLFSIRYRIWQGTPQSEDDQAIWDHSRSQLPECPIFRRVQLSADDQLAQDTALRSSDEITEALFAEADQLSVSEKCSGVQEFSATFDLRKCNGPAGSPTVRIKPWWARVFRRRNASEA